jgi:hypothetical protein
VNPNKSYENHNYADAYPRHGGTILNATVRKRFVGPSQNYSIAVNNECLSCMQLGITITSTKTFMTDIFETTPRLFFVMHIFIRGDIDRVLREVHPVFQRIPEL